MADKEEAMMADNSMTVISSARKQFLETLGEAAARVEEVFCLQVFQTFQKQLALAQRRFKSLEEDRERDRAAWEEEKQALLQELVVWRSGVNQGIASLVPETCPEELYALHQNIHLRPRESELYAVREDLRPGLGREERQQGEEGCGGEPNLAILNPPVCQIVKEEPEAAAAVLPSVAKQEANVSDDGNLSGGGQEVIDQMRQALEATIPKNRGGKDKISPSQKQKRTPQKLQGSDEFIIPVIDGDIETTPLRIKRRRRVSGDVITSGSEPYLIKGDIVNSSPQNSNFHVTGMEDPNLDKLKCGPAAFVDALESDGGKARAHRAPSQPSTANHISSMKENVDPQLQAFPKTERKEGPLSIAGNPAKPLEPSKKHQMQSPANKLAPAYKYVEPVRNQSDREALQGFQCKQCEKFYGAVHMQNAGELVKNRCNHHDMSRHRYRHVPPETPEGFWNLGFDTDP